jgi:hypothetical protein
MATATTLGGKRLVAQLTVSINTHSPSHCVPIQLSILVLVSSTLGCTLYHLYTPTPLNRERGEMEEA